MKSDTANWVVPVAAAVVVWIWILVLLATNA